MPFEKGHKKKGGRTKGIENKNTSEIREAFKTLIENNLENMTIWLEKVAADNPSKALDHINGLSEYIIPKLQRTEISGELKTGIDLSGIDDKLLNELDKQLNKGTD